MTNELIIEETESTIMPLPRKRKEISEREREVLILISSGKTNKEISKDLNISHCTVKNHIARLFAKINVSNRSQATAYAIYTGLINPATFIS